MRADSGSALGTSAFPGVNLHRAIHEREDEKMPEYTNEIIDEIIALVEMAEETALAELKEFGYYDAVPNAIEAFGVHDAIETQFAGAFGERR